MTARYRPPKVGSEWTRLGHLVGGKFVRGRQETIIVRAVEKTAIRFDAYDGFGGLAGSGHIQKHYWRELVKARVVLPLDPGNGLDRAMRRLKER